MVKPRFVNATIEDRIRFEQFTIKLFQDNFWLEDDPLRPANWGDVSLGTRTFWRLRAHVLLEEQATDIPSEH